MSDISTDDKLGYILMLDVSDSMRHALTMVKIDAKVFVRCSRIGDQFGVNAFSNNAFWVYPKSDSPNDPDVTPDIATVGEARNETLAAIFAIEELDTISMTNMAHAIQLANDMISKASTPLKAFVLLSDGYHNSGPDPASILGDTPPIFIAGLDIIDSSYFNRLIKKNQKSRFYNAPNSDDMEIIFNHILADSNEANLALNSKDKYARGSDSIVKKFTISEDEGLSQLNIVWSDKKYRYTSGTPSGNNINVILMDPDHHDSGIKPDISEDGYCIYNLQNAKPGEWHIVIQYSIAESLTGVCGGIEFNSGVMTNFEFPSEINLGEDFVSKIEVSHKNNRLEQMSVKATISKPLQSVDEVIKNYENDLQRTDMETSDSDNIYTRLQKLRNSKLKDAGVDIFPLEHSLHSFEIGEDGIYRLAWSNALVRGIYNINVEIEGVIPATGRKYKSLKRGTFVVN
jgi:hypothetical protein